MKPIKIEEVQEELNRYTNQDVYLHLETTNGAYAATSPEKRPAVGAYIRNGLIRFSKGTVAGLGPYRIGLKLEFGWVYAEGLTDWEVDDQGRLLIAGHDESGKLAVTLELSHKPF